MQIHEDISLRSNLFDGTHTISLRSNLFDGTHTISLLYGVAINTCQHLQLTIVRSDILIDHLFRGTPSLYLIIQIIQGHITVKYPIVIQ